MAVTRDLWIVLRARDEASRIIRSFSHNLGGAANAAARDMTNFESAMANVALRMNQFAQISMLAGASLAGIGAVGLSFIHDVTQVAAEYDRQVRHTLTQVDDLSIGLEKIGQIGRNVARDARVPFEELQETLFFIFSSINVNAEQAEKLLRGFAKEAVAGQSTIEAAAKSTIAIMNSLGLSVDDLTRIQDVQFQIVRKGIINYEELASVIGRALPATARAGQSFETVGAMIAFLTRNGLSAAMAATSAARALESFAHPVTLKRLEGMGITVRNIKGEFLPLIDVMGQMNEKIKIMSAPDRAKFLQELFTGAGGTIQARRFWDTAFKNFDQFQEMMGFMQNSAGVFENAYETMSESVAAQSELIRNKWMLIKEALGKALMPQLLRLLGLLDRVMTWFDSLPEGTKTTIAQFILWGSIISVVVGALLVFIGVIAFTVSGIMMAGTALISVLAALTAVTLAIIGLGAGFIYAWKNSESFRNAVKTLRDFLESLWNIITSGAEAIASAFRDKLQPSLERLWNILKDHIVPTFMHFMGVLREEVLPKIAEAKNVIVDLAEKAFGVIAYILDNVVIPAAKRMAEWWKEHADVIRPLLAIFGQAVKWLLIIAAVLIGLPIVAIITAFAGLILAFEAVIDAIQTIWGWLKVIGAFFADVWNAIYAAVSTAINAIIEIITGALSFIWNTWNSIWNLFAPLIKEVLGLIGDIFRLFGTLAYEIFKDWIMPIVNFVVNQFNAIKNFLVKIWNDITAAISYYLSIIYDTYIKPFVEAITNIWNKHLKGLFELFKETWDRIVNSVSEVITKIKDTLVSAGSDSLKWLYDVGKNVIQGLIDGVTEKIKDLRKKFQEITELIPKIKGPRSVDIKLLMPAGENIMKGLMAGIASQLPMLYQQLGGITAKVGQIPLPSAAFMPIPQQAQAPEQRTFQQTIIVNTNEINPRVHAMELGFELESRL